MSASVYQWPAQRSSHKWRWVVSAIGVFTLIGGEGSGRALGLLVVVAAWTPTIWRHVAKHRYFNSPEFETRRVQIAAVVNEHNELADYIDEIRARGSFSVGASRTGQYAHLAQSTNTSNWNYQRDRNVAELAAPNVHNCGLTVVRNAQADPIRYLTKYFDITADEQTLADVEAMGSSISSLEEAVENLHERELGSTQQIDPPRVIRKHFMSEFLDQIGVHFSPITVPYPIYKFQYVSAGGNSGQETVIRLDSQTIDALVETVSQKIRWRKSAAGQRALMTTRLRNYIKQRDSYMCQQCGVSLNDEPHLLLEVDHVIPVSRGGLTEEWNLKTLCWKCNRAKSNKMPV
jgi:5-methylcytosine-specific restriction endonuclease McrA